MKKQVAADGFDPSTSGLWAQHASTAPRCSAARKGDYGGNEPKTHALDAILRCTNLWKNVAPNKGLEPLTLRLKV